MITTVMSKYLCSGYFLRLDSRSSSIQDFRRHLHRRRNSQKSHLFLELMTLGLRHAVVFGHDSHETLSGGPVLTSASISRLWSYPFSLGPVRLILVGKIYRSVASTASSQGLRFSERLK